MDIFKDKDRRKDFKKDTMVFDDKSRAAVATGKKYANLAQSPSRSSKTHRTFSNDNVIDAGVNVINRKNVSSAIGNITEKIDIYTYLDKEDKKALKEIKTDVGGGARIASKYDKNGVLESKVFLSSRDENKATEFIDKANDFIEDIRFEDNKAAASHIDDKASTLFQHSADHHRKQGKRYKQIAQYAKSEAKQLEKEIKADKANSANVQKDVNSYFNGTNGRFSDRLEIFSDNAKYVKTANEAKMEILFTGDKTQKEGSLLKTTARRREYLTDKIYINEGKKLESKFETRNLTRQEKLEQSKSVNAASKKSEKREVRKAASLAAASKFLETKKYMQNEIGDMSGEVSGDLLKDGSQGIFQAITDSVKNVANRMAKSAVRAIGNAIKNATATLIKWVISMLPSLIPPVGILLAIIIVINVIFSIIAAIFGGDSGDDYTLSVTGDGYMYTSLSNEDIDSIIDALYDNYADMSATQEAAIRYALSKVGCEYNQDYHASLTEDIFDCSSLTYRSYISAGVDISNQGIYTAAEECRAMDNAGNTITGDMKPGDLIFYGGSDNGRYKGIYHVAIYVGRVDGVDKMVEARGKDYGVVYCDVRSKNVVNTSRPY
jgi:cell wall-associated NlpC family hydrolase